MPAEIEKISCPGCGRFIGLIHHDGDYPDPDDECCRRVVRAVRRRAKRARKRQKRQARP